MVQGKYKILGVFTGKRKILSGGMESAIHKTPVETLVIKKNSLPQDDIVDLKHHGGDMRVVHHYSQKNYDHLKKTFPEIADRFIHGSFGENIVTEELTEEDLYIGDIYKLGSAKVQLTVLRRPCATLNQGYDHKGILKEVMQSGHVGWFYRVLEEGEVKAGDYLEFLERPYPDLKAIDLYWQGYGKEKFKDLSFLKECLDTGLMDKGWKPKLEKALN